MQKIYFTSDLHLGHTNIIKYCNRPFTTTHEMNQIIINNINNKVNKNDKLYILGDFCIGNPSKYRELINCDEIILIIGNHDKKKTVFTESHKYLEIKIDNKILVLCHYPILSWHKMHYGSIHLYGHCHGKLRHPNPLAIDVGVDSNNFTPLSLEEINARVC